MDGIDICEVFTERFVVYLAILFQGLRLCIIRWRSDKWMMIWKGCARSSHGLISRYYPSICLQGLIKSTKALSHDSWCPGWDLNLGPPKYKAGVLTAPPQRSISQMSKFGLTQIKFAVKDGMGRSVRLWDFRFSQEWKFGLWSSRLWHHVIL
jgi:hypothetical protein